MKKAPDAGGYMELIRDLQKKCADISWQRTDTLGQKVPIILQALDPLLCALERAATCFGGCRGGDHRAEFLTGRAVSSCQAALLLMTTGYYDEALSIIRSLSELANLMALFVFDKSEFERWKVIDEKVRRREFAPVKVRVSLEKGSGPLPIGEKLYAALSSYSIHPGPDALPQAHSKTGNAHVGPFYQEVGLILCINEVARSMAFIGIFAPILTGLNADLIEGTQALSRVLAENIGGITADVQGRPWFKLH